MKWGERGELSDQCDSEMKEPRKVFFFFFLASLLGHCICCICVKMSSACFSDVLLNIGRKYIWQFANGNF